MSVENDVWEALTLLVWEENLCASDVEVSNLIEDFIRVTSALKFNKFCEDDESNSGFPFDYFYGLYRLYTYCQNLGGVEGLDLLAQSSTEFRNSEHIRAWKKTMSKNAFKKVLDLCCLLGIFREKNGTYYCV